MQHKMRAKFGLSLSTRAVLFDWGTMDDLVDAAVIAEKSGYFSGVWVGDNLLSKPRVEAIVTLSAIAARTEQVSLGTICLASFPMRDPVLLAIQWASLDLLSRRNRQYQLVLQPNAQWYQAMLPCHAIHRLTQSDVQMLQAGRRIFILSRLLTLQS